MAEGSEQCDGDDLAVRAGFADWEAVLFAEYHRREAAAFDARWDTLDA